jgi:hypothetical protein
MEEDKINYCDKDGNCTAPEESEAGCKHYERQFGALICTHRAWQDSCLSPNALTDNTWTLKNKTRN